MPSRTIFLSKLLGLYLILVTAPMLIRKDASVATVNALGRNASMLFVLGVITLAAGLAMVLCHNFWSGGIPTVLVTLLSWLTLIKGLLFLFLSPEGMIGFMQSLHYDGLYYFYLGVSPLIGAYLTWVGFFGVRPGTVARKPSRNS